MVAHTFDVLICGAGIAGLYCARRILRDAKTKGSSVRVGILEVRPCVGGRIRTSYFPDHPNLAVELGAMRYLSGHHLVAKLVEDYQLDTLSFPTQHHMYHLRGTTFNEHESFSLQKCYSLNSEEQGMNPKQLLAYAIDKAIPREIWGFLDRISTEEIIDSKADFSDFIEDVDLNIGFKNFLLTLISNEAFKLIKDGSGYDSSFHNWNAREAINHVINDFLRDSEAFSIVKGFKALLQALEDEILSLGGEFFFEHQLKSFSEHRIDNQQTVACIVEDSKHRVTTLFHGKKLVLALPKRSLINVSRGTPQFCEAPVHTLLHLVSSQSAAKVFLSFSEAWWNACTDQSDVLVTDMPLRKVYYKLPGSKQQTSGGVMLAAYADMDDYYFWDGFIEGNSSEESAGTEALENTIVRMLGEIHKVAIPRPTASKIIRWSSDNAGAAFHAWKPGIDSGKCMEDILKPVDSLPVYICGEAYSKYQCWIEGALYSTEQLLEKHFNIQS